MVKSMADNPIIFAMANPNPEIIPDDAKAGRYALLVQDVQTILTKLIMY